MVVATVDALADATLDALADASVFARSPCPCDTRIFFSFTRFHCFNRFLNRVHDGVVMTR